MKVLKEKSEFDSKIYSKKILFKQNCAKLFKKPLMVYSNEMSYEEKKLICRKLKGISCMMRLDYMDTFCEGGFVDNESIGIVEELLRSISRGDILSEKEIDQVNKIIRAKGKIYIKKEVVMQLFLTGFLVCIFCFVLDTFGPVIKEVLNILLLALKVLNLFLCEVLLFLTKI